MQFYASIILYRYRFVPVFVLDRPYASMKPDFFCHDFPKREGLERSDSKSDTILFT